MLVVKCDKPVSWYWQALLGLALGFALGCIGFCTWRAAFPLWFGLLLTLGLLIYTYQTLALLCWRTKPQAIVALTLKPANKVEILCRDGENYQGQMCPGGLVLAPMTLLQVHAPSSQFKGRVVVEAKYLAPTDYRALARWVREVA